MTWTYSVANLSSTTPATAKLAQVRYLVGDTISTDPQVQDEEINFALTQKGSIYGAGAIVCRSLAAQLSRQADVVDKDLRTTLSAKATAYAKRAVELERQGIARSGAQPYAGGISIADKVQQELNPDRVTPQFQLDMEDNYLPVAPVGNEGTPDPSTSNEEGDDV